MKKAFLLFSTFCFSLAIYCQVKEAEKFINSSKKSTYPAENDKEFDSSSNIKNIVANENQIKNIKKLGLIWGFLKYYHPNIAKGNFNWDFELFRVLPKILSAQNDSQRDSIFSHWIINLGAFEIGTPLVIKPLYTKLVPDLDWLENSNFSTELTALLLNIKRAKRIKEHYYIKMINNLNPDFKNENSYSNLKYPDAGFRVLTLFRYWNMIQYFYPNKHLIEGDWKIVLEEFIPKLLNVTNETEYTFTVLELIVNIQDTHANMWGGSKALEDFYGQRYAPVELTFIENEPIVTHFYDAKIGKETGLKIGDIITTINNKKIETIIMEKLKYYPASNYPTKLRNMAYQLLKTNDSIINIEFTRDGKSEAKTINTFTKKEIDIYSKFKNKDTCFKLINSNIAYINNGSLKKSYLSQIWPAMKNTKGLILDLRNYPSDFPIYELGSYLMPNKTPFVKYTIGNIHNPGLFTITMPNNIGKKNKNYYTGKVIILVNEQTQSSAEFHAMAYRASPNAIVIGSTTAGADGNVSYISLPGGLKTMISGIGILYPDGKETQRIGIVPDIECKPTIKGVKNGRDEILEKAIELINQK